MQILFFNVLIYCKFEFKCFKIFDIIFFNKCMFENIFSLNIEKQWDFIFKIYHFYKHFKIDEYKCFDEIVYNHSFDKHSIHVNKFLLNFLL